MDEILLCQVSHTDMITLLTTTRPRFTMMNHVDNKLSFAYVSTSSYFVVEWHKYDTW